MSRIDEALRRAGMTTPDSEPATAVRALENFPDNPDTAGQSELPAPSRERTEYSRERTEYSREQKDYWGQHTVHPTPAAAADLVTPAFFERLVVHNDAEPLAVEQYRKLAASLHQAQVDRGIRVVMVASAQPAEGKTLTAANLALTLSESYRRRVLLIDADLRRPSLNRLFQLPHSTGLSENLKSKEERALHLVTLSPTLVLLPAGSPDADPMAGLTSERMRRILQQASENFDWVIVDTPPVTLLTDTNLLAALADSVVLVVGAGSTQCPLVQQAIVSIGREKIAGVVLNRVEKDALKEAHYYSYYTPGKAPRRKAAVESQGPQDSLVKAAGEITP